MKRKFALLCMNLASLAALAALPSCAVEDRDRHGPGWREHHEDRTLSDEERREERERAEHRDEQKEQDRRQQREWEEREDQGDAPLATPGRPY